MRFAVLAASNFTDPEHERLIWLAAGGLALLGVLLTIATVVWWRGTKGEHAALAPLELMGDRSFTAMTPVEQSRRLDAVRLQLDGDVEPSSTPAADAIDLDEALRAFQPGFDDLRDDSPEPVPAAGQGNSPRLAVTDSASPEPPTSSESPAGVESDGPTGRTPAPAKTEAAESDDAEDSGDAASTGMDVPSTPDAPAAHPSSTGGNGTVPHVDPLPAGEPAEC